MILIFWNEILTFVICFDSPVVVASSSAPDDRLVSNKCQKRESKLKIEWPFWELVLRRVVKENGIWNWTARNFCYGRIYCHGTKSHSSVHLRSEISTMFLIWLSQRNKQKSILWSQPQFRLFSFKNFNSNVVHSSLGMVNKSVEHLC